MWWWRLYWIQSPCERCRLWQCCNRQSNNSMQWANMPYTRSVSIFLQFKLKQWFLELFLYNAEFCQEPPNTGSCKEMVLSNKWFYHFEEKCCKLFTYTCGNEKANEINRFESRFECMKVCSGIIDPNYFTCNRNMEGEDKAAA